MEKIIKHIETLLCRHDYVVLPDFGGFVIQNLAATIGAEQIDAPTAVVGFNSLMSTSDGLLAIEISRAENKSFREAVQLIETEISQLKTQLKKGASVPCGRLGTLSLSADHKIIFSPAANTSFLPANYGLNTLYYSAIAEEAEGGGSSKKVILSIPWGGRIARYAAVGIIAVGLMFTAPKLNNVKNGMTASFSPTALWNGAEKTTESVTVAPAAERNFNAPAPVSDISSEVQAQQEAKKFHVIVGCMATQKMADELCDYLKKHNYNNAFVLPPIKTYRVSIDSFTKKDDAVAYMENLRKTNAEFPDAWVLTYAVD